MKPTLLDLLRLGLRRGSRWRVLALFAGLAIPPAFVATLPGWLFLSIQLDRSVAAEALGAGWTTPLALELLRRLSDEQAGRMLVMGFVAGLVLTFVVAPWSAGAALAEGRAPEAMRIRGLLAAAGDLYGRLVRMTLVAALPLGVAVAIGSGFLSAADDAAKHALTEAAAFGPRRWALAGLAALVFLAHLTLDAGRAHLAAHPERRSAFLAWTAGAWMVIRRPVATVVIGATGTGLAFVLAFLLMAARGHLPAGSAAAAAGFVLATLATAAIAWGRSVRLAALSELAAFDAGERVRKKALRAARKAEKVAPTEPLLPAVTEPTPEPAPVEPRAFDVTAPVEAPPKLGEG